MYLSRKPLSYIISHPLDVLVLMPFSNTFRFLVLYRLIVLFHFKWVRTLRHTEIIRFFTQYKLGQLIAWYFCFIAIMSYLFVCVEPDVHNYSDALWMSLVTTATVGYGDLVPQTLLGRYIAVSLMFLGICFMGLITTSMMHTLRDQRMRAKRKHTSDLIDSQLLKDWQNLPPSSQKRVATKLRDAIELEEYRNNQ